MLFLKTNGVVELLVVRLELFMGSSSMSYCRMYDVICNNMIYRDIWGRGRCITSVVSVKLTLPTSYCHIESGWHLLRHKPPLQLATLLRVAT